MQTKRRSFLLGLAAAAGAAALPPRALARLTAPDRLRAALAGRGRNFLATPFGEICYRDVGPNEPGGETAVFLHAYPLNSFQWRGAIELLALDLRCIAPDFLGLGHTRTSEDQDLRPLAQARMLVALIDGLGIDRIHLVANGSGNAVAKLLVAHYPERVRSLILTNGDTARQSPPAAMNPVIELASQGRYVSRLLEPWYENPEKARAPDGIGGLCYADPANPTDDAIEAYFGPILATARSRRLAERHAIAQAQNPLAGIEPLLRSARLPVRILWGADGGRSGREDAVYLDRLFPASRGVREISGARLFWPEEQPHIIADELRLLVDDLKDNS